MATKIFTLEEANRVLPLVRGIVRDIVSTHRDLQERVAEFSSLRGNRPDVEERRWELRQEIDALTETVNGYIAELHELGCLFKGFEEGLVDFYTMRGSRPVFLCWKLGEEQIEWWHELDSGYAGRQPLSAFVD